MSSLIFPHRGLAPIERQRILRVSVRVPVVWNVGRRPRLPHTRSQVERRESAAAWPELRPAGFHAVRGPSGPEAKGICQVVVVRDDGCSCRYGSWLEQDMCCCWILTGKSSRSRRSRSGCAGVTVRAERAVTPRTSSTCVPMPRSRRRTRRLSTPPSVLAGWSAGGSSSSGSWSCAHCERCLAVAQQVFAMRFGGCRWAAVGHAAQRRLDDLR